MVQFVAISFVVWFVERMALWYPQVNLEENGFSLDEMLGLAFDTGVIRSPGDQV
jgi:hypothetical protein